MGSEDGACLSQPEIIEVANMAFQHTMQGRVDANDEAMLKVFLVHFGFVLEKRLHELGRKR